MRRIAWRKRSTPWRADGSPVTLTAVELSRDPAFAGQLMNQARTAHPAAVINNSSSRSFVIPAAGSVRGAGNTFFRSDITFVNWNETPQAVAVMWLPSGGTAITFRTTFSGRSCSFRSRRRAHSIRTARSMASRASGLRSRTWPAPSRSHLRVSIRTT